ncbi:hypothetical protein BH20ACT6_BH20ACT6_01440 [soil metagenome]
MILTLVPLDASWVGHRVVVRYRLEVAGDAPPGTPTATDVLGTLVAFDSDGLAVLSDGADPAVVRVPHRRFVTGKPVPPRASTLSRVSPEHLMAVCDAGWPARTVEQLGDWRLREAGGFTGRANSALPVGDPGPPLVEALQQVEGFYARHRLPALAQVIVGSDLEGQLPAYGWAVARHGEGVIVQVAPVAMARRAARSRDRGYAPAGAQPVTVSDRLSDGWARLYGRTAAAPADAVEGVLTGPQTVGLAAIGDPPVAVGRGVVTGDWLGLSAVEVEPAHRRRGLARRIVDELLAWGAERGARSAYLQTMPDNAGALGLYGPYGFVTHHRYRYWGPIPARPGQDPSH